MVTATFLATVLAVAGSGDVTLLQFTADWCGACQSVKPSVQRLAAAGYPIREVNVDREPALASQFRVTSVPCFVLLVNGREVERVAEASSYTRLVQMFERAGVVGHSAPSGGAPAAIVRGQSGEASSPGLPRPLAALARGFGRRGQQPEPSLVEIETGQATTIPAKPTASLAPAAEPAPEPAPAAPPSSSFPTSSSASLPAAPPVNGSPLATSLAPTQAPAAAAFTAAVPTAATTGQLDPAAQQRALAATVRLRIDDLHGHSVGTGTIIDTRESEALVVTCGHVFRDSSGKGQIAVDLFANGQTQTVSGTLISYDLERDLGFVAIPVPPQIAVAPVAPAGFGIQRGQAVFSVGCDRGADPTVRASRITGIDRYVGAPNIEVAGQPTEGRSGGGLFSSDGKLIGVCNAADPTDNEGIFAALPAIHWELDRIGQRRVYAGNETQVAQVAAAPSPVSAPPPAADRTLPAMTPVSAVAASNPSPRPQPLPQQPPRAEIAIDAAAAPVPAGDTEVICIVRSRGNPQGTEQLFILEQPSRDLLDRLATESRTQPAASLAQHQRLQPIAPSQTALPAGGFSLPPAGNVIRAQSDR